MCSDEPPSQVEDDYDVDDYFTVSTAMDAEVTNYTSHFSPTTILVEYETDGYYPGLSQIGCGGKFQRPQLADLSTMVSAARS